MGRRAEGLGLSPHWPPLKNQREDEVQEQLQGRELGYSRER